MTALLPVIETTVSVPRSIRDVRAREWGQDAALEAAVAFWLSSKTSAHTKAAYSRDIRSWFTWCRENGVPADDARRADVDAWRESLTGSAATVARMLAAVSSFYSYWLAEDVVARNPAQNAVRPKVSADPVSIALTLRQAHLLLGYIDGPADLRAGVIVRLLAETGMRVGELCGAQVTDLGMTSGHHVLGVTRKGGKRQELPIAAATRERVGDYLDGRADGWLIHVNRTERRQGDGRMDRSYVRQLLRRLAREAGLPEAVHTRMHPHVLRHSAATLMHADGVPVAEIQLILGHADIRTTQRYIHHAEGLENNPVYRLHAALSRG
jgi:site-specific recombinase XerD